MIYCSLKEAGSINQRFQRFIGGLALPAGKRKFGGIDFMIPLRIKILEMIRIGIISTSAVICDMFADHFCQYDLFEYQKMQSESLDEGFRGAENAFSGHVYTVHSLVYAVHALVAAGRNGSKN